MKGEANGYMIEEYENTRVSVPSLSDLLSAQFCCTKPELKLLSIS